MAPRSSVVRRLVADRSGVSAIVLALSLTSMLGFAGLAVDVSLWYFDKRTALGASDSAAFSAIVTYNADVAAGLSSTNAQTNAVAAAKAVTATYGYANGVNGVTVTVNDPPKSGSHKSPPSGSVAFEVIVTKTEPQFFSGLFVSGVSVTGRSVAEVSTSAAKNGAAGAGCIEQFAASGSVNMSNGVSVTTKSCAIYGNGTGSAALSVTGGANLTVDGINLVGSITQNQGGAINNSGTKLTGQAATPDPYASYTISAAETTAASEASADASAASKAGAGYTPSGSCPNSTPTSFSTGGKTTTIYPGFYCGGLTAGNNNNIIMSPGVYVVVGGQFSMQGGITVTATGGVTVVLTGSGSNYATANIANGVNFNLTAPSTGSTAGLAFYGDPNAPLSNTSSIAGGANMVINGGIYMKSQTIDFSNGTSNAAACTQLIAGSIVFTGGAVFTNNCTSYGTQGIAVTPAATSLAIVE